MMGLTDSYATDNWIMQMFDDWFDPCPLDDNWTINGLLLDWPNKTFVNPPYSNPSAWVEKAIETSLDGKIVVMLLKHDTSTKWFKRLHEANARFLMIAGRLKYNTGKAAPFPSVLVVLDAV